MTQVLEKMSALWHIFIIIIFYNTNMMLVFGRIVSEFCHIITETNLLMWFYEDKVPTSSCKFITKRAQHPESLS